MALAVVSVVVGYLLGTVPTAYLVGRRLGHDPSHEGSGNPGASNVYRTIGRKPAAVVLAVDVLKGALAAGLGWAIGGHTVGLVCGFAAVVGHSFPLVHRGGKGVATCAGVVAVLFPLHGLATAVGWVVVAKVTRRPSVASIVLAVGVPLGVAVTGAPGVEVGLLVALAVLVLVRHAGNISRLVHGTERPIETGQP